MKRKYETRKSMKAIDRLKNVTDDDLLEVNTHHQVKVGRNFRPSLDSHHWIVPCCRSITSHGGQTSPELIQFCLRQLAASSERNVTNSQSSLTSFRDSRQTLVLFDHSFLVL